MIWLWGKKKCDVRLWTNANHITTSKLHNECLLYILFVFSNIIFMCACCMFYELRSGPTYMLYNFRTVVLYSKKKKNECNVRVYLINKDRKRLKCSIRNTDKKEKTLILCCLKKFVSFVPNVFKWTSQLQHGKKHRTLSAQFEPSWSVTPQTLKVYSYFGFIISIFLISLLGLLGNQGFSIQLFSRNYTLVALSWTNNRFIVVINKVHFYDTHMLRSPGHRWPTFKKVLHVSIMGDRWPKKKMVTDDRKPMTGDRWPTGDRWQAIGDRWQANWYVPTANIQVHQMIEITASAPYCKKHFLQKMCFGI